MLFTYFTNIILQLQMKETRPHKSADKYKMYFTIKQIKVNKLK